MEIEDFEKMLVIKKHQLDEELAIQADVQWRISEKLAAANANRDDLKEALARVESDLTMLILREEPKLAVTKIEIELKTEPKRMRAFQLYMLAKQSADRWSGLYEAWKARGFAIKSLCDLYASNYFVSDGHSPRQSSDSLHARYDAERARRATIRTETKTRRRVE